MTTTEQSHSQIKWLLFALSVLVAIGAFILVWIPYQRQMRLIEEIEAMGGRGCRGRRIGRVASRASGFVLRAYRLTSI